MVTATTTFGAALTTLADSALSSSSFHHSGLATSAHSFNCSVLKANAVAFAHFSKPTVAAAEVGTVRTTQTLTALNKQVTTIGVLIEFERPVCVQLHAECKPMGRLVLREAGATLAAGVITRIHEAA
eukprot:scaffold1873_cov74-Phaeocystis_antarctica.AAC.2